MILAKMRKERGLSQKELAVQIGCSQNLVSQWETGTRKPSTTMLKKLASFFDVSVDYLLLGAEPDMEKTFPRLYFAKKVLEQALQTEEGTDEVALLIQNEIDKASAYKEHLEFGVPIKVESKQIPIARGIGMVSITIGPKKGTTELRFDYTGKYIIGGDEYDVGEFVAFCCTGDNAKANDLEEGDMVIAKLQKDVESGDVALIAINGSKLLIQRVTKFEGGIVLETAGENYSPLVITGEKLNHLTIMGKVVEMRRKM